MNLSDFVAKYLYIECEVGGATLYEPVESLALAWKVASGEAHCHPLKFALHLRSLVPTVRVEEIAPAEIIVFGLSLTPEARLRLT